MKIFSLIKGLEGLVRAIGSIIKPTKFTALLPVVALFGFYVLIVGTCSLTAEAGHFDKECTESATRLLLDLKEVLDE